MLIVRAVYQFNGVNRQKIYGDEILIGFILVIIRGMKFPKKVQTAVRPSRRSKQYYLTLWDISGIQEIEATIRGPIERAVSDLMR